MITLRPAGDRGRTRQDWLDSWHSFSFGDYVDPAHTHFGPLRVINEDWVRPGQGFGMHGHRDMEIITLVLSGQLAHQDTLGNAATLRPGEVQRMSAGLGIRHSEFNPSDTEPAHFLQIWIEPLTRGGAPDYEQTPTPEHLPPNQWHLLASPDGRGGAVSVNQHMTLWRAVLSPDQALDYPLEGGRQAWVQVLAGTGSLQGQPLSCGDGAGIRLEEAIQLTAGPDGLDLLLFDLPMG